MGKTCVCLEEDLCGECGACLCTGHYEDCSIPDQIVACNETPVDEKYDMEVVYGTGETDPTGIPQHESGAKLDSGKPDCSLLLLFGKALTAVAEVGTYGAAKYTRGGWRNVVDGINRYTAALIRHLMKEEYEEYDTDLPVRHSAQVAWNALARLELLIREKEGTNEKTITDDSNASAGTNHSDLSV